MLVVILEQSRVQSVVEYPVAQLDVASAKIMTVKDSLHFTGLVVYG
jgi:hypothetical protein